MVTGGDVQFEQASSKITPLTARCVALTAGPALTHTDVFDRAQVSIGGLAEPSIRQIVDEVKKAYAEIRNERAEERFLRPLGLNYQMYLQAQSALASDLAFQLGQQLTGYELGLHIIIAGVDRTGGHLYMVADPGTAECFDALGFVTIGSGSRHAEAAFISHSYTGAFSVVEAAFVAFEARRRAESAPGVGNRLTDLVYIGSEVVSFDKKSLCVFQNAYAGLRQNEDDARKKMREEVQSPGGYSDSENAKEEDGGEQG